MKETLKIVGYSSAEAETCGTLENEKVSFHLDIFSKLSSYISNLPQVPQLPHIISHTKASSLVLSNLVNIKLGI